MVPTGPNRPRSDHSALPLGLSGRLDQSLPAGKAVIPARQIAVCQGLDVMFARCGQGALLFPLGLEITRLSRRHIRSGCEDKVWRMLLLTQRDLNEDAPQSA